MEDLQADTTASGTDELADAVARRMMAASPRSTVAGGPSSVERHSGLIVSGRRGLRADGGEEIEVDPGELFAAEAGHDAWVIGDQPCIALDRAAGSP